jgi:hypothetical protein
MNREQGALCYKGLAIIFVIENSSGRDCQSGSEPPSVKSSSDWVIDDLSGFDVYLKNI